MSDRKYLINVAVFLLTLYLQISYGVAKEAEDLGMQGTNPSPSSPPPPSSPSPSTPNSPSSTGEDERDVYTIIQGLPYGNFDIMQDGVLTGFNNDIVKAVCEEAGIRCTVVFDVYSECVLADPITGMNIPGRYLKPGSVVAGCVGWINSVTRNNFANYTKPYIQLEISFLITHEDLPNGNTTSDGDTVAFVQGFSSDPGCLAGAVDTEFIPLLVNGVGALLNAVRNGDAAFGLIGEIGWDSVVQTDLVTVDEINCGNGLSVATPLVGREDFIDEWNKGFDDLPDEIYTELCLKWEIGSCIPEKLVGAN